MNHFIAFAAACIVSTVSISSTVFAAPIGDVAFTLKPVGDQAGRFHGNFRVSRNDRGESNWSDSFRAGEFVGLDHAALRSAGTRPVRFAMIREAGRLDCAGLGGASRATGHCRFTPDAAFLQALARLGVGRPTESEAFGLMSLGARRATVEAIVAARYPAPSVGELMGLTALGVDAAYVQGLAAAGYRLRSADELLQFKALGIDPEWIRGFVRIGYSNLPASELVQMKALAIRPDFIAGFERVGYGRLPVESLVQLKALGVTPAWAHAMERRHGRRPSVDQLVQMKALGFER